MASQPSQSSAARAMFFGPSAPRKTGMSSRRGWIEAFSGLPKPVPPGQREGVVLAVVGHGPLALPDVAHDPHVFARAGERLGERHAVPALHDLGARDAEPEDEAATGEVVHGHRGHRRGRGLARGDLDEGGAQVDALGLRAPPRQRRQAVGAVGLGGPDRVVPQALGLLDGVHDPGRRAACPVTGLQAELEFARHGRGRLFHSAPPWTNVAAG